MRGRPFLDVLIASVAYAIALAAWPLWFRPLAGGTPALSLAASATWALAATVAVALLATRRLADPLRLWQRLAPVALAGSLAIAAAFCAAMPQGLLLWHVLPQLANVPSGAFGLYCPLWLAAWGLRLLHWWGTVEEADEAPLLLRRSGVRFWLALLVTGFVLQFLVARATPGGQ